MFYYRVTDSDNNVSYEERPIRSTIVGGEEIDKETFDAELTAFFASMNSGTVVTEADTLDDETEESESGEEAE